MASAEAEQTVVDGPPLRLVEGYENFLSGRFIAERSLFKNLAKGQTGAFLPIGEEAYAAALTESRF